MISLHNSEISWRSSGKVHSSYLPYLSMFHPRPLTNPTIFHRDQRQVSHTQGRGSCYHNNWIRQTQRRNHNTGNSVIIFLVINTLLAIPTHIAPIILTTRPLVARISRNNHFMAQGGQRKTRWDDGSNSHEVVRFLPLIQWSFLILLISYCCYYIKLYPRSNSINCLHIHLEW